MGGGGNVYIFKEIRASPTPSWGLEKSVQSVLRKGRRKEWIRDSHKMYVGGEMCYILKKSRQPHPKGYILMIVNYIIEIYEIKS